MTEQQKSIIKTLREQNFSYNAIAKAMGVTVATVKSYCQRSGLAGNRKEAFQSQSDTTLALPSFCRCCGKQLIQREKVKQRKFCSDECFSAAHREPLKGILYSHTDPESPLNEIDQGSDDNG